MWLLTISSTTAEQRGASEAALKYWVQALALTSTAPQGTNEHTCPDPSRLRQVKEKDALRNFLLMEIQYVTYVVITLFLSNALIWSNKQGTLTDCSRWKHLQHPAAKNSSSASPHQTMSRREHDCVWTVRMRNGSPNPRPARGTLQSDPRSSWPEPNGAWVAPVLGPQREGPRRPPLPLAPWGCAAPTRARRRGSRRPSARAGFSTAVVNGKYARELRQGSEQHESCRSKACTLARLSLAKTLTSAAWAGLMRMNVINGAYRNFQERKKTLVPFSATFK